jgi:hypothetical protein
MGSENIRQGYIAQGERILHRDREYFTGIENISQG